MPRSSCRPPVARPASFAPALATTPEIHSLHELSDRQVLCSSDQFRRDVIQITGAVAAAAELRGWERWKQKSWDSAPPLHRRRRGMPALLASRSFSNVFRRRTRESLRACRTNNPALGPARVSPGPATVLNKTAMRLSCCGARCRSSGRNGGRRETQNPSRHLNRGIVSRIVPNCAAGHHGAPIHCSRANPLSIRAVPFL